MERGRIRNLRRVWFDILLLVVIFPNSPTTIFLSRVVGCQNQAQQKNTMEHFRLILASGTFETILVPEKPKKEPLSNWDDAIITLGNRK